MESRVSDVQLNIVDPVILPVTSKEDIKTVVPKPSIAQVTPNQSTSDLIIIYKNKKSTNNCICSIILVILGIIIVIVMIL